MRVIGLDPGLRRTGWGVIEAEGDRLRHLANGAVISDSERSLAERLVQLHEGLLAVLAEFCARGGRGGDQLGQQEPGFDAQARHGARNRATDPGAERPAGRGVFADGRQESGGRHRTRQERAGRHDGRTPVARLRHHRRRCRRCAGGRHLPRPQRGQRLPLGRGGGGGRGPGSGAPNGAGPGSVGAGGHDRQADRAGRFIGCRLGGRRCLRRRLHGPLLGPRAGRPPRSGRAGQPVISRPTCARTTSISTASRRLPSGTGSACCPRSRASARAWRWRSSRCWRRAI